MGKTVAFLGLGVMGYPMAGHLAKAGYEVRVFNRTRQKADQWVSEFGGAAFATPHDAAQGAEIVFCCVGADQDLRDVCVGDDGAFGGMSHGAVFCDHTTVSAEITRKLAAVAEEKGLGFVDAPVSGGEAGAVGGQLTVMCGGARDDYLKVNDAINVFAKMQKLMGPVGAGQTTKMVNQICIAGVVQGLAEAVHFASEAGLDTDAVVEVISKGAAQSWQMENRWQTMAKGEFDFGFAVDWMRKDLAIVLGEANNLNVSLPVTALVDQFYQDVQNMGGSRQDTSSLIRRFKG